MDYYFDIVLQPDQEMQESVLMNLVYTKLHKGLVTLKSDFIGVSFPTASLKPGYCLRLHGSREHLEQLNALDWLGGLAGYCKVDGIKSVPANAQFRTFSRKQTNQTNAKLRRLRKRGSISESDIKRYRAKMFAQGLDNPYFNLVSQSNGKTYRRFVELGELQGQPTEGTFDSFGLSKSATVPWF